MRRPTHQDLIDLALERLEPSRREAIEAWLGVDADLAERARKIREHLHRYDALPPAPPPPPIHRVLGALPLDRAQQLRPRLAWRPVLGLGLAAAAVLVVLLLPWRGSDLASIGRVDEGVQVLRDGAPVAGREIAAGDRLRASQTSEARLEDGVRVVLADAAVLEIASPTSVRLEAGRVFFVVAPRTPKAPAFVVGTPAGDVEVIGTSFEVAVGTGVEVSVATGRVRVAGREVEAGFAWRDGQVAEARERPGAFFRRPRLDLVGPAWVVVGEAVPLVFRITNPGPVPITVQGPEGVRVALWLEVLDPAGETHDVPVVPDARDLAAGGVIELAAGARIEVASHTAGPFGDPGSYRCRAMYRPEGEPPLVSETLFLEVR